jgi:hypothetical protein
MPFFWRILYSNGTTKLTGREKLTKNTFCVDPVGPTDKENQVKMYKSRYCFRYISSLQRQGIRIRIEESDPDPCQIEKKDPYQSKKQDPDRIKRVWICNTVPNTTKLTNSETDVWSWDLRN